MSQEEQSGKKNPFATFKVILGLGMGLIYIALGFMVIYTKKFGVFEMSTTSIVAACCVLFPYGGFRIYRGYVDYRQNREA